ncbi:outer membrane protein assembly factor BamB family protein [Kitasatospora azatica]|uniref:outer membrane protein assembly factor BamB family protein n=1 Tax=Kitasatospora azatica TaxID=58347 RepID=UPI000568642D|nr:PQQ-binding-like beta-propeller repeat protein [Kitasatospora azatica]
MTQDGYEYQHSWYPGTDQQPPQYQPQPGDQTWQWHGYQEQYQPGQHQPGPYSQEPYSQEPFQQDQYQQVEAPQYVDPYAVPAPAADPDPLNPLEPVAVPAPEPDAQPAADPTTDPAADPAPGSDPASSPRRGGGSLLDRARSTAKGAVSGVLATDGLPDRRALLIRGAAGVAALAVLITAGIVVTSGGSGSKSTPAGPASDTGFAVAHNKIWAAQPAAAPQQGGDDTLTGSWLLADALVRADSTGVHAYDLATGKPTWTLDAPAQGAVPCGLSPTVNPAGLGGALFRTQADPKSPCTLLAAVDTKAGKTAWTKKLSDTNNPYAAHVAVTDDKVIAVGDDKVSAWAAADGKDAWQYGGQGKFCTLSGNASGATVLLHSACADSNPGEQVVALGVADGKVTWSHGLDGQPKTVSVLSAEPAALLTTGDQPTDEKVLAFGQNGDPAGTVAIMQDGSRLDATHGTFDPVPTVFFQDHTLVSTLAAADGTLAAAAYDLGNGKQLWHTAVNEKGTVRAVGLDNGALVLGADERVGQPAHLSRFALTTGQESVGGGFPRDTGSLLTSGRVLIGGGRVLAVPEHSTHFGTATAYQAKS